MKKIPGASLTKFSLNGLKASASTAGAFTFIKFYLSCEEMKLNIKHIAILLLTIFYACNGPNLTELKVKDNSSSTASEVLDLENLAPEANGAAFSANYDSTGILNPTPGKYFNIISFSKIKNVSANGASKSADYATAQFFDRTKPIKNIHNRTIGYKSVLLGDLFFNKFKARTVKSCMHLMMNGTGVKVDNGMKYLLVKETGGNNEKNIAPYGGIVDVSLKHMHMKLDIIVNVPDAIDAKVFKKGDFNKDNLKVLVTWQNASYKTLEIILGGIKAGESGIVPLIRFKTPDDGKLFVPAKLFNSVPLQKFKYLILSLIRRSEKEVSSQQLKSKFYISSQSIQNIKFEIQ